MLPEHPPPQIASSPASASAARSSATPARDVLVFDAKPARRAPRSAPARLAGRDEAVRQLERARSSRRRCEVVDLGQRSPQPRRAVRRAASAGGCARANSAARTNASRSPRPPAAASSSSATSALGSSVESARWRARRSGSDAASASRACSARRAKRVDPPVDDRPDQRMGEPHLEVLVTTSRPRSSAASSCASTGSPGSAARKAPTEVGPSAETVRSSASRSAARSSRPAIAARRESGSGELRRTGLQPGCSSPSALAELERVQGVPADELVDPLFQRRERDGVDGIAEQAPQLGGFPSGRAPSFLGAPARRRAPAREVAAVAQSQRHQEPDRLSVGAERRAKRQRARRPAVEPAAGRRSPGPPGPALRGRPP